VPVRQIKLTPIKMALLLTSGNFIPKSSSEQFFYKFIVVTFVHENPILENFLMNRF